MPVPIRRDKPWGTAHAAWSVREAVGGPFLLFNADDHYGPGAPAALLAALDAAAFDEAGWFRTGDLGFLDADGHLVITGRLKDVIIRKGENLSAKELEDHLYEHAKVRDVAVVGLPDAASGELARSSHKHRSEAAEVA